MTFTRPSKIRSTLTIAIENTWSSLNADVDITYVTGYNMDKSIRLPAHTQLVTYNVVNSRVLQLGLKYTF